MRWAPSDRIMVGMSARELKVTAERRGLVHVDVLAYDSDAGEMRFLRAGSIDGGEWHFYGASLSDVEIDQAMAAYRAAQ